MIKNEFFNLYDKYSYDNGWELDIHHSSISDWYLEVGFKITDKKHGEIIVKEQDCDINRVFAKAYIKLTDWLSENKGGY